MSDSDDDLSPPPPKVEETAEIGGRDLRPAEVAHPLVVVDEATPLGIRITLDPTLEKTLAPEAKQKLHEQGKGYLTRILDLAVHRASRRGAVAKTSLDDVVRAEDDVKRRALRFDPVSLIRDLGIGGIGTAVGLYFSFPGWAFLVLLISTLAILLAQVLNKYW